ncbi:hypothetical protein OBBRIDRAFT_168106 [Obba rivulosa]|uniref:Uncharacterized protein n=1 Tax=Obba rivulosa TaxID=1052685 RepID=A0A8E2DGQ1_9APHY|nr:hypothetical protein OBBRIDRAFT_168106 [Obba rivulosa]
MIFTWLFLCSQSHHQVTLIMKSVIGIQRPGNCTGTDAIDRILSLLSILYRLNMKSRFVFAQGQRSQSQVFTIAASRARRCLKWIWCSGALQNVFEIPMISRSRSLGYIFYCSAWISLLVIASYIRMTPLLWIWCML